MLPAGRTEFSRFSAYFIKALPIRERSNIIILNNDYMLILINGLDSASV